MSIRFRPSGEEPKPDSEEYSYSPHDTASGWVAIDQLDLITRRLGRYTTTILSGTALNILISILAIASQPIYIAWLKI